MIRVVTGDIWKAAAEVVVIPVNAVGVMGAGLALAAKTEYPEFYRAYKAACMAWEIEPVTGCSMPPWPTGCYQWLYAFPTKHDWRRPSRLSFVSAGLVEMARAVGQLGPVVKAVAIPALGCGLGGLPWREVRFLIESAYLTLKPAADWLLHEPG